MGTSDILDQLMETARRTTAAHRAELPETELEGWARREAPEVPGLREALAQGPGVSVIAEIKRASPSRGAIRPDIEAGAWAEGYRRAGATAISVLTEPEHFSGKLEDLRAARRAGLPLLRKDFISKRYQILEARLYGASAVLLLAAALEPEKLRYLHEEAASWGLDALVEVHNEADLARVEQAFAGSTPPLVGVNQRNLTTLKKDPGQFEALASRLPAGALAVAESGISTPDEVAAVAGLGYRAVLVGTSITSAKEPEKQLRKLARAGLRCERRTQVKICGLTSPEDLDAAVEAGVDYVGLVRWPKSSRYVSEEVAAELSARLPTSVGAVGVYVDATAGELNRDAERCSLDFLQLHGDESPELPNELVRPAWKALRIAPEMRPSDLLAHSQALAMLLDAHVAGGLPGGTGRRIGEQSLETFAPLLEQAGIPWILAGGLDPDNVGKLVERYRPWAVDVSSGVERAPGEKDPARMEAFVAAVRG